jgi:hypothetical protein
METEENELKSINLGRLTNAEFYQCINRQITEIEAQGKEVLTDVNLNEMIVTIKKSMDEFDKSILLIQKSIYTDDLAKRNKLRKRAFRRYKLALNEFKYSEDEEELRCYQKLLILSKTFYGAVKLNYEAQTNEMFKFVEVLESESFSAEIAHLNLTDEVTRMKNSNLAFNQLFDSRSSELSAKPAYNAIQLRKTVQRHYNLIIGYVVALVTLLDQQQFTESIRIVNNTRNYFDIIIHRREGVKEAAKEKKKKEETVTEQIPVVENTEVINEDIQ